MAFRRCIWDLDEDPDGNVQHIAEHDLTIADVEHVLADPLGDESSLSSGRPLVFGFIPDGRLIAVVYEEIDELTVYPVTAYEVE
jgi:uncharacterized DUF497 family protein